MLALAGPVVLAELGWMAMGTVDVVMLGHLSRDALGGASIEPLRFVQARLAEVFSTKTGLTRFLPGRLKGSVELPEVEWVRWQGSGDLMAAVKSNCYIVVPPNRERLEAGDAVTVLLT